MQMHADAISAFFPDWTNIAPLDTTVADIIRGLSAAAIYMLGTGVPVRVALGSLDSGRTGRRSDAAASFRRWRRDINDRRSRSRLIAVFTALSRGRVHQRMRSDDHAGA